MIGGKLTSFKEYLNQYYDVTKTYMFRNSNMKNQYTIKIKACYCWENMCKNIIPQIGYPCDGTSIEICSEHGVKNMICPFSSTNGLPTLFPIELTNDRW